MKKKFLMLSLLLGMNLAVAGCGTSDEEHETASAEEHSEHGDHIDYEAQEEWAFTSGEMQSPIDIVTTGTEMMPSSTIEDAGALTLNYETDISAAENNGHSIQVTNGGTAVINGRDFELAQFHYHADSEHTVDGEHYPIEMHFVNKAQDGRLAVVAVFFEEGAANQGFQQVLDNISNETTEPITNLYDMIPENLSYYHYLGSLTTPPLTENVEWYILKDTVQVSAEQIAAFDELYDHNNREVQPLNDRVIVEYNE